MSQFAREQKQTRIHGSIAVMITFTLVTFAFLASCTLPNMFSPLRGKTGTLSLSVGVAAAKTLVPGIDMNIALYEISAIGPNGTTLAQSTEQSSISFDAVPVGQWTVAVTAKNGQGTIIAQGSSTIVVSAGTTASLSIIVTPLSGYGSLGLAVTWKAGDLQAPTIEAHLLPPMGSPLPLSFAVGSGSATSLAASIPSGYYTLSLRLLDNGRLAMGAVEIARVVKDQTTSGTFDFSLLNKADPTISIAITPTMNDPLVVTLRGQAPSLVKGTDMTVAASVAGDVGNVTYVWYINGDSKASGSNTNPSFTFGSALPVGVYRLDVTAFTADGLRAGSTNCTSFVTEAAALTSNFPIGVWLQDPLRVRDGRTNAVNYKDIGVNTFVGLWGWPSEAPKYPGYNLPAAQALKDAGMTVYAGSSQAAVDWNRAHPEFASTFAGYLLGDEPDMNKVSGDATLAAASMPTTWQQAGDALRAADPTRAIYANFGKGFALDPWVGYHTGPGPTQADDFAKYVEPTTFLSSDYYAVTDPYERLDQHGIWGYGRAVDNTERNAGSRAVWGVVEASAPFAQGKVANNIAGRMPPDLIMAAVWEMIVHGADGIIYFCHDFSDGGQVEDGCLADPGMPAAMKLANASVQSYAAVLQTPDVPGTNATSNGSIAVATLTKRHGGFTYVFAMADGSASYPNGQPVDATISVSGAGNGTLEVLNDGRFVSMASGQFTDQFSAYELHIYRF